MSIGTTDKPLYPTKTPTKTSVKARLDKIIKQLYGNGSIHNMVDKAKTDHKIVLDVLRQRIQLEPKESKADSTIHIQLDIPNTPRELTQPHTIKEVTSIIDGEEELGASSIEE